MVCTTEDMANGTVESVCIGRERQIGSSKSSKVGLSVAESLCAPAEMVLRGRMGRIGWG